MGDRHMGALEGAMDTVSAIGHGNITPGQGENLNRSIAERAASYLGAFNGTH
jgi:hypothetical protein